MSIIDQAISEMQRANFPQEEQDVMRQILTLFFDTWDSGGAVWAMTPVLQKLIEGRPLSPLTGEESEWFDHGPGGSRPRIRQNLRCSSIFENTETDGTVVYRDLDNPAWDGTFPYEPDTRN